jgi:hypothetical protein
MAADRAERWHKKFGRLRLAAKSGLSAELLEGKPRTVTLHTLRAESSMFDRIARDAVRRGGTM